MPQATTIKPSNNFVKGFISDVTDFNSQEGFLLDESNIVVDSVFKKLRRRKGIDYENNYVLSNDIVATEVSRKAIQEYRWESVGGDGNRTFIVQQIGDTLFFHDASNTTLSSETKSFTINLDNFTANAATSPGDTPVDMDSGQGYLFVVGKKIDPFYVSYNANTDSITTNTILIEIRDLTGVDDGLDVDESPSTLSNLHRYNLQNQGWNAPASSASDPITQYQSATGSYPSNAQIWWQGKDSSSNFDPTLLDKYYFGNAPAPKGHFVVRAFNIKRSDVSGIGGIPNVTEQFRPETVAFFAGRLWYSGLNSSTKNGNVFISKLIEDEKDFGVCYQVGDPTSEEAPDLLATDGTVIRINEAGKVHKLFSTERFVYVFCSNGVWVIGSPNGGFNTTDFFRRRITEQKVVGRLSVANARGTPVWLSDVGVHTVENNQVSDLPTVVNLSDGKIKSWYIGLNQAALSYSKAAFDPSENKIYWLYKSQLNSDGTFNYSYDNVLMFDIKEGAFNRWKISSLTSDSPILTGVVETSTLNLSEEVYSIIVGSDSVVVGSNDVVINTGELKGSQTFLKFSCAVPQANGNYKYTYADFANTNFVDWETADEQGATYDSFAVLHEELFNDITRRKTATYVYCFFELTENTFVSDGDTGYVLDKQSGCLMEVKWDFADSAASNKISAPQQVYRFRRPYFVDPGSLGLNTGFKVIRTRNKVRGSGLSMQLKFANDGNKDFNLLAYAIVASGNSNP